MRYLMSHYCSKYLYPTNKGIVCIFRIVINVTLMKLAENSLMLVILLLGKLSRGKWVVVSLGLAWDTGQDLGPSSSPKEKLKLRHKYHLYTDPIKFAQSS